MGYVNSQQGLEGMPGTSLDVIIDEVNLDNAWVIVYPMANQAAVGHDVSAVLTDSTTLRLEREGSGGSNSVSWFVVEDSNAVVQRGSQTLSSGVDDVTFNIDPVDLSKSFIVISRRSEGGAMNVGYITAVFDDDSTVRLEREEDGGTVHVEWQVITINDAVIQSGKTNLFGTTNSETINEVNLNNTFLVMQATSVNPNLNESHARGYFTGNNEVEFSRNSNNQFMRVSWYVVSCDRYKVQEVDSGDVTDQIVNISIDEVDLNKSWITASTENSGAGTSTANARWRTYFDDSETVVREKQSTNQRTWMNGYVIEMEPFETPILSDFENSLFFGAGW